MVTLTAVYAEQSQAKEQVLEGRVHFCSGKPELNGYCPSSCVYFEVKGGTRLSFETLKKRKVGLYEFLKELDWRPEGIDALTRLAKAQGRHLYEHRDIPHKARGKSEGKGSSKSQGKWGHKRNGTAGARENKEIKLHTERSSTLDKAVQRMRNFAAHGSTMPIEKCPCQPGYTDIDEWREHQDVHCIIQPLVHPLATSHNHKKHRLK